MTFAMRAALLLVLPALVACRTQCMADEDASPEQMAKEKKAASRAQIVCKELQRPTIDAKGDRLKLSATSSSSRMVRSHSLSCPSIRLRSIMSSTI